MEKDVPVYLIFVVLNRARKDIVDVNVRLSDATESTAVTNSLTEDVPAIVES